MYKRSAVTVALAARAADVINRKLALANIVARLRGNRATLSTLVIHQPLDLVVRVSR
jgi:hypothetical protein